MFETRIDRLVLSQFLVLCGVLSACAGSEGGPAPAVASNPSPVYNTPLPPAPGAVILKSPTLSFSDTGVSISDGITRNGIWDVESDYSWEYSLDMGISWIKGVGGVFEVKGDGSRIIWVRAYDDAGNTSATVVVNCVLDTMPPPAVAVSPGVDGFTRTLGLAGIEAGARWEYSLDNQITWLAGSGSALGTLGNGLSSIWLRQVDIAGNVSAPQVFDLQATGVNTGHEASTQPLQPSSLANGLLTMLIHGVVVRGDADYVRWDIPMNHRLKSLRLVRYVSDDSIAFFAVQASSVFDAGVNVDRMLVYVHMGPADLGRNVTANVSTSRLGAGPMTLWFQQTGLLPTQYAIEVTLEPLP